MQNKMAFWGSKGQENKYNNYFNPGYSEIEFWMPHTSRAWILKFLLQSGLLLNVSQNSEVPSSRSFCRQRAWPPSPPTDRKNTACQPTINHPLPSSAKALPCSSYRWWAECHCMLRTWMLPVPWVSSALPLRFVPLKVQWRGWSGSWGPGAFRRDRLVSWVKWWGCRCSVNCRGCCCCWLGPFEGKLAWS